MPNAALHGDVAATELRHRIHQQLIDELGPILFDRRLSEEDLRRRVHEQLHAAIALERVPLSAADKAQLASLASFSSRPTTIPTTIPSRSKTGLPLVPGSAARSNLR